MFHTDRLLEHTFFAEESQGAFCIFDPLCLEIDDCVSDGTLLSCRSTAAAQYPSAVYVPTQANWARTDASLRWMQAGK